MVNSSFIVKITCTRHLYSVKNSTCLYRGEISGSSSSTYHACFPQIPEVEVLLLFDSSPVHRLIQTYTFIQEIQSNMEFIVFYALLINPTSLKKSAILAFV